ncbi:MAG: alpha/beta hydrolase [Alphaproteobacteria bacterium]
MRHVGLATITLLAAFAMPACAQKMPKPAVEVAQPMIETTDMQWAKPEGADLGLTLYRDKAAKGALPVLVDVHGGAWASGDRKGDVLYCTELAKTGLLVVSIDFRQGPQFQHPSGSADVAAAVRWVRLNAKALNADPKHIGLIGSSSGGHLALLESLRPDAAQHKGTPISDGPAAKSFAAHDDIDASVDYVVAMWPVSDPAARFRYATRAKIETLQKGSLAYFGNEDAMWDASIQRIVTSGEAKRLPPILVIQPGNDSNIPQDMTFDLLHAWQARGGEVEYAYFPGQPHAFGHRPSEATTDLIRMVGAFIQRRLAEPETR